MKRLIFCLLLCPCITVQAMEKPKFTKLTIQSTIAMPNHCLIYCQYNPCKKIFSLIKEKQSGKQEYKKSFSFRTIKEIPKSVTVKGLVKSGKSILVLLSASHLVCLAKLRRSPSRVFKKRLTAVIVREKNRCSMVSLITPEIIKDIGIANDQNNNIALSVLLKSRHKIVKHRLLFDKRLHYIRNDGSVYEYKKVNLENS